MKNIILITIVVVLVFSISCENKNSVLNLFEQENATLILNKDSESDIIFGLEKFVSDVGKLTTVLALTDGSSAKKMASIEDLTYDDFEVIQVIRSKGSLDTLRFKATGTGGFQSDDYPEFNGQSMTIFQDFTLHIHRGGRNGPSNVGCQLTGSSEWKCTGPMFPAGWEAHLYKGIIKGTASRPDSSGMINIDMTIKTTTPNGGKALMELTSIVNSITGNIENLEGKCNLSNPISGFGAAK